jgi:hypothetical protein
MQGEVKAGPLRLSRKYLWKVFLENGPAEIYTYSPLKYPPNTIGRTRIAANAGLYYRHDTETIGI